MFVVRFSVGGGVMVFEDIDKFWINEVESYAEKNVDLILIGNKSDLGEKK